MLTIPRNLKYCVFCVIFLCSLSLGRPFDWQYNYTGAPFALFYNPSLIGNNAGYAFGLDGRYLDGKDYDGRFALVAPVGSNVWQDDYIGREGYDYLTSPYIFGRNAVSIGGMYKNGEDGEDYFASAGFTTPIYTRYLIRGGASVDFAYNPDSSLAVSLNAAVSAPVAESNLVSLTAHNIYANDRNYDNRFGFSIGAAGLLYSDPYLFLVPYDFQFSFYFKDNGKIDRTEAIARLSFDLTPLLAGRERTGQTVTVSGGYGFVNQAGGGRPEMLAYAALGIVFVNRASAASFWGGHGRKEGGYGAFMYNSFKENSRRLFARDDITAALKHSETDSGQTLFTLDCRGTNIESWVLRIDGLGGRTIRTFSGGNVVPATILWDGLDSEGKPLKENEPVQARLIVTRRTGAVVESDWVNIAARE